jgi:hypothetical protein
MFWLLPFFFFAMVTRRRRWKRWHDRPARDGELEAQRSTIDALETRVAQLEERLDFTERLLAGRSETAAKA